MHQKQQHPRHHDDNSPVGCFHTHAHTQYMHVCNDEPGNRHGDGGARHGDDRVEQCHGRATRTRTMRRRGHARCVACCEGGVRLGPLRRRRGRDCRRVGACRARGPRGCMARRGPARAAIPGSGRRADLRALHRHRDRRRRSSILRTPRRCTRRVDSRRGGACTRALRRWWRCPHRRRPPQQPRGCAKRAATQ